MRKVDIIVLAAFVVAMVVLFILRECTFDLPVAIVALALAVVAIIMMVVQRKKKPEEQNKEQEA